MSSFNEFIELELPRRPFTLEDGSPNQLLVRSEHVERPRELVWTDIEHIINTYTTDQIDSKLDEKADIDHNHHDTYLQIDNNLQDIGNRKIAVNYLLDAESASENNVLTINLDNELVWMDLSDYNVLNNSDVDGDNVYEALNNLKNEIDHSGHIFVQETAPSEYNQHTVWIQV